ncbi:MAG: metallophosphoesterase family protein [Armatimonadota bacterium]
MKRSFQIPILAIVLLGMSTFSRADFTFVQITDTHTGTFETAFNARFNEAIRQIQVIKPAFVLHTGDALQGWSPESAKLFNGFISRISCLTYVLPGNHDIPELPKLGAEKASAQIDAWNRAVGPNRVSFTRENCIFIGLDSNLWNTGYTEEKIQLEWLKSELRKTGKKRIFIFQHSPIYLETSDEKNGSYFAVDNPARGELLKLIKKYKVEAVITGHYHRMNSTVLNGTSFLTSPATSFSCDPDQGLTGYTVFKVYTGGFSHRFVDFRTAGSPPDFTGKQ